MKAKPTVAATITEIVTEPPFLERGILTMTRRIKANSPCRNNARLSQINVYATLVFAASIALVLSRAASSAVGSDWAIRTIQGDVNSLAFSADGTMLATNDWKSIKLREARTAAEIRTLHGHRERVHSVAFSPNGKLLASGSEDDTIKLWDTHSGAELRTLQGHKYNVESVAFSPDGKLLASRSGEGIIIWEPETGVKLRTIDERGGECIAFSPDGKLLASHGPDYTIKLWAPHTGEEVGTFRGHTDYVMSLAFSPDGRLLASASFDYTIKLWDVYAGAEIKTLKGNHGRVYSVAFSPDGKVLVSGGHDGTVALWSVTSGSEIGIHVGHADYVYSVAFSPDGASLASGSERGGVKIWDPHMGLAKQIELGGNVSAVALSPNGKLLACSQSGKIKLWDPHSESEVKILAENRSPTPLAFSLDGTLLAGWGRIWNLHTGATISIEGQSDPTSFEFSPDGRLLASGNDSSIELWDTRKAARIRTLKGHSDDIRCLAFSPNGKLLASGSDDRTIKLWNSRNGAELGTLKEHQDYVISLAFSPNGKLLASGSADDTIKLWDVDTQAQIRTIKGNQETVWGVVFSPDGKTLASGHDDGTTTFWDSQTGEELRTAKHGIPVGFTPDGKSLVTRWGERCFVIDCATVSSALPPTLGLTGKWYVSPGPLVLAAEQSKVTGSYSFAGGRVEGTVSQDGKTVTGTWTQSNGHSGGFVLALSRDGQQVEGRRWVGENKDDGPGYVWSGKRLE